MKRDRFRVWTTGEGAEGGDGCGARVGKGLALGVPDRDWGVNSWGGTEGGSLTGRFQQEEAPGRI